MVMYCPVILNRAREDGEGVGHEENPGDDPWLMGLKEPMITAVKRCIFISRSLLMLNVHSFLLT